MFCSIWEDCCAKRFGTISLCFLSLRFGFPIFTGRYKGGFVKGWFWRMYPRSGFRSGGTFERTLVPVFRSGGINIRMYPRSGFRFGGTSAKTTLFQRTAKGASGKGSRQKTSKFVKKCQNYFRQFSTFFAQGKTIQKSSKSVKNIFDIF